MERFSNKSVKELEEIRDRYVGEYIGCFDKPLGYKQELKHLDRLIAAKQQHKP